MTDILIRDLPDEVVGVLDDQARQLGLSRNEYVRRQLSQVAERGSARVTVADLERFSRTAVDLADDDVMKQAWS